MKKKGARLSSFVLVSALSWKHLVKKKNKRRKGQIQKTYWFNLTRYHHLSTVGLIISSCRGRSLPDISCELFPLLHKHIRVARLRRVLLMLLWDVEGHGELRFTRGAGAGVHATTHGGRHLHFHL